jgi:adenylosuccinate lyase
VDTAQSIRLKKVNNILLNDLVNLEAALKKLAVKHIDTFQIGRTHGIHAEITTFGYTLAL